MNNLKIKIAAGLCLWILSIQGIVALTLAPKAIPVGDDPSFEIKQSSGQKLFFDQTEILKLEPAPQDEIPLLPVALLPNTSDFSERQTQDTLSEGGSVGDRKYGLTILIFPFHLFW